MKHFLSILFLLPCLNAFAGPDSAAEACREFSTFDSKLGVECLSHLKKGDVQKEALSACRAAGQYNSKTGVACLREVAGKTYDPGALGACRDFHQYQAGKVSECLAIIENKTYSKEEIEMCRSNGQFNSANGVSCLKKLGTEAKAPPARCPSPETLLRDIRSVRKNLRGTQIETARDALRAIEAALESCENKF